MANHNGALMGKTSINGDFHGFPITRGLNMDGISVREREREKDSWTEG